MLGLGLSRFLPFSALVTSRSLGYQKAASFAQVRQMSDIYVTVFDEGGPAGGGVLIYPSKYLVHQQKRNLLGLETDTSGDLFLRSLQSDAADDVAPSSFRMLFVHLATGLPAMDLYANDDVLLTTVSSKAERGDVLP